jgi:TusA-related sulfurtransferase
MNKKILDVSELEAPYPLIKAIKEISSLKKGDILIFKHRMKPSKLIEEILRRNLKYEIIKENENNFEMKVFI